VIRLKRFCSFRYTSHLTFCDCVDMDATNRFQDLTGIEDLSVCRDVLQRHNWNLEVAVQVLY